jgi:serine/threonine protein kinase
MKGGKHSPYTILQVLSTTLFASLNHPHICTLYDTGRQDAIDFLVMEYLEGETLATRLMKGPLPLDQVLRYASLRLAQ